MLNSSNWIRGGRKCGRFASKCCGEMGLRSLAFGRQVALERRGDLGKIASISPLVHNNRRENMKLFTRLTVLVALLVLVTVPAFAQATSATLAGTVTSDGKPLPGATITVTSPAL